MSAREDDAPRSLGRRLGWFAALWLAGVVVVVIVAYGIRMLMP